MASSLPASVLEMVEMSPLEDVVLSVLRDAIPDVPIQSLIADDQTFPVVVVRRTGNWGVWRGDRRFVDSGQLNVHVFCEGLEADSDAALLSEAVRVALRDAINKVVPLKGHISYIQMVESPSRAPDWATAVGPVQYADLPTGTVRYESVYQVRVRRSPQKPFAP